MTDALFVVSEEGYWGEECVEPLETLTEAGVEITVATPSGDPPVVDERSLDPEQVGEETAEHVREVAETDERLNDPIPVAQADADGYDAVVFPGGHGTEWDINQDKHARELFRDIVEGDGKALVVSATPSACSASPGQPRRVYRQRPGRNRLPQRVGGGHRRRGRSHADGRKLPYWVEDEVKEAGGNWDAELDSDTSVTVDGDLVTARGPGSSSAAAETLLEELGV